MSQSMPTIERPKVEKPQRRGAGLNADALAWDDDELETQIYDNPEDKAAATVDVAAKRAAKSTSSQLPLAAAPPTPAPVPPPAPPPASAPTSRRSRRR